MPFSLFKFVALHDPVAHFQSLDPGICGFGITYSNNLNIYKFSFLYALNMSIIKFKKIVSYFIIKLVWPARLKKFSQRVTVLINSCTSLK